MPHFTIDLVFLLLSTIIGFIVIRKEPPFYLKLVPVFLLITLFVELTGQWYQKRGLNNVIIFNFYAVLEFSFFIYFFNQTIPNIRIKRMIRQAGFILPAACLFNTLFGQGPHVFNTYNFIAGSLVMVVLSFIYFYQLFKKTEAVNLLREPAFWISTGILFFFVSSVSVLGVVNYVSTLPKKTGYFLQQLLLMTDVLFYILFIIAFLCRINIRKSLSS